MLFLEEVQLDIFVFDLESNVLLGTVNVVGTFFCGLVILSVGSRFYVVVSYLNNKEGGVVVSSELYSYVLSIVDLEGANVLIVSSFVDLDH